MKLTGGEIIVKKLKAEGVPYILGIPGHGVLGLFDAIRKAEEKGDIKYIQVKHEQAATAIADGYYRVKKEPLAVFSSIGPGTLNLGIGLGTAYADSTPFLAFCGDTHVHMSGVGVLQELERYKDSNIIRSLEPLSKRVWRAESARQLSRIVGNAFREMTGGRKGPCVVALPMDVQSEYAEYGVTPSAAEPSYSPAASAEAIEKAVALMKTAKRPVILAGGGAMNSGAGSVIVKLAEKWGAGIITTLAAKGTVAETHPQYCFHTGSKGTAIGLEIASKADVILALGTRFADETTCSYRKGVAFNFPDTKLIQVDIDAHELGKNYPVDVGIIANAKDTAEKILAAFGEYEINEKYLEEIKALREKWFAYVESNRNAGTDDFTISKMIGVMNDTLPDDTIIATSSGNTQAQLFQEYCYKKPNCNLTTGGFSTMGWAFPAAMGAKLAAPERPVVALVGDGDFMMVMQELSTMAQYEIPITVIVADNSGWMAIKDLQIDVLGKNAAFGNDFELQGKRYDPDFAAIAEAFHISSYKACCKGSFEEALKNALEDNKAGRPAFIHVPVSNEYPYSGGKAFGWWDVPIPAYMEEKRKNYIGGISEETV
ncbi:MAG: thiamine pyrophosphate-binding protein [Clostridia bacterium]|nr:thiamine pyrophosphate-binding protein [Clostridia bacterium]MBQ3870774.1 thiamine pyrophosphate-binding protein [Clostridia bacterium]